ncbi:MAG: valine--pyruvate transaminase [Gammaproteobacteria bacterium]|nr:MAG: valine--pyruvate transaminase [Gammaproteobacteria bacterium]
MTWKRSKFGERFARLTGAGELMEDLGLATAGEHDAFLLGGGNPGKIPAMQSLFRRRLVEIAASDSDTDQMLGKYPHPKGDIAFRTALAGLLSREYDWPLSADNIALTGGSQSGFFLLFNMLAGEFSDGTFKRILLPVTPEYVGYTDVGLDEKLFVSQRPEIEDRPDGFFKYHVNFDTLDIVEDVAAICVSRPTNPTGNVIGDEELLQLDGMARRAGVPFIIDNAYGLPFPRIVFTEATPFWNENVVLCMSLSKLGLPGIRTGIIIAHEEIVEALSHMTAVQNLAVASAGAVLLQPWLENGEIIDISRRFITPFYEEKAKAACKVLKSELEGISYKIHVPEGAFFLWLWLPGLPITSHELYQRLKTKGVFVMSGHHFFPGLKEPWRHRDECLRLSYSQDEEVVQAGMRIIGKEVRELYSLAG